MSATSQPFSSQQSRIQSCIATNWANFLKDPALIPPLSVTFCCIGLSAQDSMGPGALWVLFDEATEVRTAGDYDKLWSLIETKIHTRKKETLVYPFLRRSAIPRLQEYKWRRLHGHYIASSWYHGGRFCKEKLPSPIAHPLPHPWFISCWISGENNAFRKAKLPRKTLCPHSTSAAQGISE